MFTGGRTSNVTSGASYVPNSPPLGPLLKVVAFPPSVFLRRQPSLSCFNRSMCLTPAGTFCGMGVPFSEASDVIPKLFFQSKKLR